MLLLTDDLCLVIPVKMKSIQRKTRMGHKGFNLSIKHEFNEVVKTKQTLPVSHWQFVNFPDESHPFFQNYIKFDIATRKSNSNAYQN